MLATLLVFMLVAVMGLVLVGITLAVVGAMLALAIKAIPLLLIGLIVVKLVRATERRRLGVYAADQRWLDS